MSDSIFLQSSDPEKQWVVDRLIELVGKDSVIPSFPDVAMQLCSLVQREASTIEDFADVISLDPGLTARCLQAASSVSFAARPIDSIQQALMLIGVQEIRRIALAVATIGAFSEFRAKIDWRRFWLHNVMVARLAEKVASSFRQTSGMEYLAGLLHDIGKLLIEHCFPREFEKIVTETHDRKCGYMVVEREVLGLDHTQIGAALCETMHTYDHVLRATWFHHDPLNSSHTADPRGDGGFLAVCVAIADRLAHRDSAWSAGMDLDSTKIEQSPEWSFLQRLYLPKRFDLDLNTELKKAQADLSAFVS